MEKFKIEFTSFFKKVSHIATYIAILVIGLIIGYYYCTFQAQRVTQESPIADVKTLQETSVAFTARNELLIINRETGRYIVYQDSVSLAIFNLVANQKYNAEVKK